MAQEGLGWKASGDIHIFGVGVGYEVIPTPSEMYTHDNLWEMIPRWAYKGQIPSPISTLHTFTVVTLTLTPSLGLATKHIQVWPK